MKECLITVGKAKHDAIIQATNKYNVKLWILKGKSSAMTSKTNNTKEKSFGKDMLKAIGFQDR